MLRSIFILSLLSFVTLVASAQTKVACVGNSVTYGATIQNPEQNSYPAQLQRMLGEGYEVANFGRSGATLLSRGHNPYIKTEQYQAAKAFAADIVVIHLGLNDTDPRNWPNFKDDFATDYSSLIDSLKQNNKDARVIIARLSPIFHWHPRFEAGTRDWYYEVQYLIEAVAEHKGVELIDFQEVLHSSPQLMPDALHPNEQGAELLAKRVYSAITGDFAGLSMPMTYSDNMVLQRGENLRIEGTANRGQSVRATLAGKSVETVADMNGEWELSFGEMSAGGPFELRVSTADRELVYKNVMVGEVWLASGQSNMEWHLHKVLDGKKYIEEAQNDNLRILNMAPIYNDAQEWTAAILDSMNNHNAFSKYGWQMISPETVEKFSAVAYLYGKMLQDSLGVPVGIICNAVGGSTAESWVSRKTLEQEIPALLRGWPNNHFTMDWVRGQVAQHTANKTDRLQRHYYDPAYLYETAITPLGHYDIAGVIWYQGESNAHNIGVHHRLFNMVISDFRNYWNDPELPFHYVQLSSLELRPAWPEFRDSQRRIDDEIENIGMVVSSDVGHPTDIHPGNKWAVAQRLALLALHDIYGMRWSVPHASPKFRSAELLQNGDVELRFDYDAGLTTSDLELPATFEVAQTDGFFVPAQAKIVDGRVVLSDYGDITPRLVRYGWQPYCLGNVVNGAALPLSTFVEEITD